MNLEKAEKCLKEINQDVALGGEASQEWADVMEDLMSENSRLSNALSFYAKSYNWETVSEIAPSAVENDEGRIACEALLKGRKL